MKIGKKVALSLEALLDAEETRLAAVELGLDDESCSWHELALRTTPDDLMDALLTVDEAMEQRRERRRAVRQRWN